MTKPAITQELVRSLFDYHEDGYLIRKVSSTRPDRVGCRAGGFDRSIGYCSVRVAGKIYKLHRVIFIWHHGYDSENFIDHIDRNPLNNRISNLREVSRQCNNRNCSLRSNSLSGVTGVVPRGEGKWRASIRVNGRNIYLGTFTSVTEAALARYHKEVELNWSGCNSTSSAYLYLKELGEI